MLELQKRVEDQGHRKSLPRCKATSIAFRKSDGRAANLEIGKYFAFEKTLGEGPALFGGQHDKRSVNWQSRSANPPMCRHKSRRRRCTTPTRRPRWRFRLSALWYDKALPAISGPNRTAQSVSRPCRMRCRYADHGNAGRRYPAKLANTKDIPRKSERRFSHMVAKGLARQTKRCVSGTPRRRRTKKRAFCVATRRKSGLCWFHPNNRHLFWRVGTPPPACEFRPATKRNVTQYQRRQRLAYTRCQHDVSGCYDEKAYP